MSLTRLAVQRPVTTLMACVIVTLLGAMSLSKLSVDLLPDVSRPTVSVSTVYLGAGPAEVETLITRPVEQALGAISGVELLSSTSTEGSSTVRVQFQWDVDLDAAVNDMRDALSRIRSQLPLDVEEPYIRRFDVSDMPVLYLGLASDLDPVRITQLAERQIVPRLEQLPGVARINLRGGVRREIQVDLDRSKLEALDLGVNEVVAALQRENVNLPGGDLEQGTQRLLVRSQGEFRSLEDIASCVVRQHSGADVRVGDVATITDGIEERTERTRVGGQEGVMLYVYRQAGANTVAVSDAVRRTVDDLNRELRGTRLSVRIDTAEFIRQAIDNVKWSAIYGMSLAVLVLIVFLRSFRSTLVIAISMPLSVLATFTLMYFQGFTLNLVSFGGLALGIGLLVDNSIVVLESIFRKRADGLSSMDAAIEGTGEVAGAIVASTATTLVVFVAMLFISGTTAIILQQLAWVVTFSLLTSLFASLTLTPVLAAYWIGDASHRTEIGSAGASPSPSIATKGRRLGPIGLFHRVNEWLLDRTERVYSASLASCLRRPSAVMLSLFALLAVSVGLTPRIGTEYLPRSDEGFLSIDAEMSPGIQIDALQAKSEILEARILGLVKNETLEYATYVGDTPEGGNELNRSRVRIKLLPRGERSRSLPEIHKDVATHVGPIAGMKYRVQRSGGFLLGRLSSRSRFGEGIGVQISGPFTARELASSDPSAQSLTESAGGDEPDRLVEQAAARMRGVPGLVNVQIRRDEGRPELAVVIDRPMAGRLGISVREIAQTLETTVRGSRATIYRDEGDEFNVLVRVQKSYLGSSSALQQIGVSTPGGRIVPLAAVVRLKPQTSPVSIDHVAQQRVVDVTADVQDRDLGAVVRDLQASLADMPLPDGYAVNITGDWEEQQASFDSLRIGFVLAVVLMYVVMAAQFESLRQPLLILLTVPIGGIGVVLVLVLTDTTLNVQSFIGIVMLAGIVVNNAIVLVDYADQLRIARPDLGEQELLILASVRRLRPILMTTATTVLAMLPIALGWGEGGELQAPMARVVCGGLVSGTLITLFAIPIVCLLFPPRRRPAES